MATLPSARFMGFPLIKQTPASVVVVVVEVEVVPCVEVVVDTSEVEEVVVDEVVVDEVVVDEVVVDEEVSTVDEGEVASVVAEAIPHVVASHESPWPRHRKSLSPHLQQTG